jgi:hypothetical protein
VSVDASSEEECNMSGRTALVRGATDGIAVSRRHGAAFWAVAFAFLVVMAFATLPSPLYGLYRTRDDLSTLTVTVRVERWSRVRYSP